jgi:hypothetical protein
MDLKKFNIPPGAKEIKIMIPPKLAQFKKVFDSNDPIDVNVVTLYKDENGDWISDDPDVELLDTAIRISGELSYLGFKPEDFHSKSQKEMYESVPLRLKVDMEAIYKQKDEFYKSGRMPENIIIEIDKTGFTLFGLPVEFRMKE